MISTILLLPHETTRERLLAPGAPMHDKVLRVWGWTMPSGWIDDLAVPPMRLPVDADTCLVLARDGAVVPEGVDRLRRVALAMESLQTVLDSWVCAFATGFLLVQLGIFAGRRM